MLQFVAISDDYYYYHVLFESWYARYSQNAEHSILFSLQVATCFLRLQFFFLPLLFISMSRLYIFFIIFCFNGLRSMLLRMRIARTMKKCMIWSLKLDSLKRSTESREFRYSIKFHMENDHTLTYFENVCWYLGVWHGITNNVLQHFSIFSYIS